MLLDGDEHEVMGGIHDQGGASRPDDSAENLAIVAPFEPFARKKEDPVVDAERPWLPICCDQEIAMIVERQIVRIRNPADATGIEP